MRSMSQQKLQNHFVNFIYFLRPGSTKYEPDHLHVQLNKKTGNFPSRLIAGFYQGLAGKQFYSL